jgi:polysaccharide biosynthesis/export protein
MVTGLNQPSSQPSSQPSPQPPLQTSMGLTLGLSLGIMLSAGLITAPRGQAQMDPSRTAVVPTIAVPPMAPAAPRTLMSHPSESSLAVGAISPTTSPQTTDSAYALGAGDLVRLDIFDTPELTFEPRYTVLLDGTLNLPWVGEVPVQGLTLKQASETLKARYKRFVQDPVITVSLVAPRPLKIGLIGAVNRPGSYIINVIGSEATQSSLNQRSSTEGGSQWPTVSKAIQTAGGIAQSANIRRIEVRRPQLNAPSQVIQVDLWKYLQEGELSQDILLRDGDTISVPIAAQIDPTEATAVAVSNFSPEQVQVNVVGEVVRPGSVGIRPNSTLNQAILAAGGVTPGRGRKTNIELIRLMPDGSVERKEFKLDLSKGLNDATNPAIHHNDVIVVNRSNTAKASDLLNAIVSPITGAFGLLRLLIP